MSSFSLNCERYECNKVNREIENNHKFQFFVDVNELLNMN